MTTALRTALESVRPAGQGFWFQGRLYQPDNLGGEETLAELLYGTLHCRMVERSEAVPGFANWIGSRRFVDRLSEANSGTGVWQGGWILRRFEPDGRVVVERHRVRFWCAAEACRPVDSPLQVGGEVEVKLPKEYREMVPGFYLALGDGGFVRDTTPTIRIYWNVSPQGAERLMEVLTRDLNREGIAFQLKILAEPLRFDRCDTAVLYFPRDELAPMLGALRRVHAAIRPWLRTRVSHLVKPLAPGVGLAEDPGDGTSFGEHRTKLLARLLWSQGEAANLAGLGALLAEQGFDLDALYRNPGTAEDWFSLARFDG
jgi:hypothetical protein